MTISDLNQITSTMQLLNKLGDRRELPPEKCRAAVLALADCMGCHRNEDEACLAVDLGPEVSVRIAD